MEKINNKVIELPTLLEASSFLPSPSFKLKLAAQPLPIKEAMALQIITIGKITLVAALPIVPTPLPIKIWSIIL